MKHSQALRLIYYCTEFSAKNFLKEFLFKNCVDYRPYNLRLLKLIRSERYDVLYNPKKWALINISLLDKLKLTQKLKYASTMTTQQSIYNVRLPNDNKKHIAEKYCELLFCYGLKSPVENWLQNILPISLNNTRKRLCCY